MVWHYRLNMGIISLFHKIRVSQPSHDRQTAPPGNEDRLCPPSDEATVDRPTHDVLHPARSERSESQSVLADQHPRIEATEAIVLRGETPAATLVESVVPEKTRTPMPRLRWGAVDHATRQPRRS